MGNKTTQKGAIASFYRCGSPQRIRDQTLGTLGKPYLARSMSKVAQLQMAFFSVMAIALIAVEYQKAQNAPVPITPHRVPRSAP